MFRRRIGVVVVVVVKDDLGERAKKYSFSHKKKDSYVRSRLAYPEDAPFSYLFLIFRDHTLHGEKRICRSKRVATRK
jgi:hypothetical protein